MSEDGIAYLDIGDAYWRGDWATAINSVWSPLYAVVLGGVQQLVAPSPRWEFTIVHLTNFGIYLLALACFEFLWRRLGEARAAIGGADSAAPVGFPEPHWWALGYALFIWSALTLIRIWAVTPDMLLAALLYAAAGLYLRLDRSASGVRTYAAFGVLLGFGYLAKSVMFLIGWAWLALAALGVGAGRPGRVRMAAAVAGFVIVVAPWVVTISVAKGRVTFGDAGAITYLKHVHGVPYPHWRPGVRDHLGIPHHPARRLLETPAVYEFATPVGGTYPMAHDPSYWYKGVAPRWNWPDQRSTLLASADFYAGLFSRGQGALLAIILLLFIVARPTLRIRPMDPRWGLVTLPGAALALYALVYVETRYVGAFLVLLWGGLFAHVAVPQGPGASRLVRAAAVAVVSLVGLNIVAFHLSTDAVTRIRGSDGTCQECKSPPSWEVAYAVGALGLGRGDRIGVIGYSFGAFFARLARVRIVAEIPGDQVESFWRADAASRGSALDAFQRAGARAVVTDWVPPGVPADGWIELGETGHRIYLLGPADRGAERRGAPR
jgi:hypothetical protein